MLKMRRIILIAVIALTALSMSAEKITVTINKQYRQDSAFVLPSKTISVKAPCMGMVNAKYIFTKKLMEILSEISVEDYDNKVFIVKLLYAGRGISINISSEDPLDDLSVDYCGDIIVGGKHFLLVQNDDNKDLIKTFFRKVRGKSPPTTSANVLLSTKRKSSMQSTSCMPLKRSLKPSPRKTAKRMTTLSKLMWNFSKNNCDVKLAFVKDFHYLCYIHLKRFKS